MTGDDPLSRAQHYRDQAANMRLLASKDEDPETRGALIQLAENYDRLHATYLKLAAQKQSR